MTTVTRGELIAEIDNLAGTLARLDIRDPEAPGLLTDLAAQLEVLARGTRIDAEIAAKMRHLAGQCTGTATELRTR